MTAEREFVDGEVVPGTRYRVVGLLGSGGMGSVYEVEHVELGKRFVLKALLRGLTNRDDLVRRLRNEWRALGQLEHVNIVGVTDAGVTTTGVPYFVMERLMGETLSSRLRRERRFRVSDALSIAADVLDGLSAAHSLGIVHRDVKPPNVFLVAGRPAKLLDFGIAKMLDPKASQITGRGIAIGTPRYMSPEQTSGSPVDARSDLYSTGIILYEMIVGAGPFDHARDGNELFLAQLTQSPPPVSRFVAVPPELDAMLLRLLAKRPGDRPESAAIVAAEFRSLSKALQDEPAADDAARTDDTIPGGPFDTLEGAVTIPSDGPVRASEWPGAARGRVGTAAARGPVSPVPPAPTGDGSTLKLEIVADEADGVTTHTAVPRVLPGSETPPPVEPALPSIPPSFQPGAAKPRRRAIAVTAVLGACGLATSLVVASRRPPLTSAPRPEDPVAAFAPAVEAVERAAAATEAEPVEAVPPAPSVVDEEAPPPVVSAPPRAETAPPAVPSPPPIPVPRSAAPRVQSAKKQAKTKPSAAPAPVETTPKKAAVEAQLPSSGL